MNSIIPVRKNTLLEQLMANHFSDIFSDSAPQSDSDIEDSVIRRKPNKTVKVIVLMMTIMIFKIGEVTCGPKHTNLLP